MLFFVLPAAASSQRTVQTGQSSWTASHLDQHGTLPTGASRKRFLLRRFTFSDKRPKEPESADIQLAGRSWRLSRVALLEQYR